MALQPFFELGLGRRDFFGGHGLAAAGIAGAAAMRFEFGFLGFEFGFGVGQTLFPFGAVRIHISLALLFLGVEIGFMIGFGLVAEFLQLVAEFLGQFLAGGI